MRLVVVGRSPEQAQVVLRPFFPAYERYGLRLLAVERLEGLPADGLGQPQAVVIPIELLGFPAIAIVRRRTPSSTVVASVQQLTRHVALLAREHGAHSVVTWEDPPERSVASIWLATQGYVPSQLIDLLQPVAAAQVITDDERRWLTLLAAGHHIREVATLTNRSYGDLKRHLGAMYKRLGVHGLSEALLFAERQGSLEGEAVDDEALHSREGLAQRRGGTRPSLVRRSDDRTT